VDDEPESCGMKFREYLNILEVTPTTHLSKWIEQYIPFLESAPSTRYSVEVNFRSTIHEVLHSFAKIALGYVSAAMKQNGYHVKHVYEEHPLRILVASRNFDDGEWIGVINFNPDQGGSFVISKGFYNRDRRTVSIQNSKKVEGDSAAEITKELRNMMHSLKSEKDRHQEKLKGVPEKRGPKG
jgi:hypothetical protein